MVQIASHNLIIFRRFKTTGNKWDSGDWAPRPYEDTHPHLAALALHNRSTVITCELAVYDQDHFP